MDWVIKGVLARASRPGYAEGVSRAAVDEWISSARAMGIRTIVCLLAEEHLALYRKPLATAGGLVEHYRKEGFNVVAIPVIDLKEPALSREEHLEVERGLQEAPLPVLVHCSAGIDRTGAVIERLIHLGWPNMRARDP